jgi:internalin A
VWRYFDPGEYAEAVLRDAPLDAGSILVEQVEHVPHLRTLHQLRDAWLDLIPADPVDDLDFLRDAPPTTTVLHVHTRRPVDLTPLTSCPALESVRVTGLRVSAGLKWLPTLTALRQLSLVAPDGGRVLSFLAGCRALTAVTLFGCSELSDLSALASAISLRSVHLLAATRLIDLRALRGLADLKLLTIGQAPLTGGLAAVTPVLDRLEGLTLVSAPTVTSLDALTESGLQEINLADCPITDLAPLATLQSLTRVWLRDFPAVDLAPLAMLPHLRELMLLNIDEPVDLSPLAPTDHRLRVELWNTFTVGTAGPLVKIRRH